MKKYTAEQIKEFAKMGYHIDENGNPTQETRLQKAIKTKAADTYNMKLNKVGTVKAVQGNHKVATTFNTIDDRKSTSGFKQEFSRDNLDSLSDEQRMAKGLVTPKRQGVNYLTDAQGTKVCRCCQTSKEVKFFSNNKKAADGKMIICKTCDSLKAKTYKEEKAAKAKKAA